MSHDTQPRYFTTSARAAILPSGALSLPDPVVPAVPAVLVGAQRLSIGSASFLVWTWEERAPRPLPAVARAFALLSACVQNDETAAVLAAEELDADLPGASAFVRQMADVVRASLPASLPAEPGAPPPTKP